MALGTIWRISLNYGAAQTNQLVLAPPASGNSIVIMGLVISTNAANNVSLDDTASNAVIQTLYFAANGGVALSSSNPDHPIAKLISGNGLRFTSSASTNVSIICWGYYV